MQPSWRGSRLTKPGTSEALLSVRMMLSHLSKPGTDEALCLRLPCAHSVRLAAGRSCPVGDMVISKGATSFKESASFDALGMQLQGCH